MYKNFLCTCVQTKKSCKSIAFLLKLVGCFSFFGWPKGELCRLFITPIYYNLAALVGATDMPSDMADYHGYVIAPH